VLEFEADDDEEDGEQAVGRPLLDGQVQVRPFGTEFGGGEVEVALLDRGVGDDQGERGGGEQDEAADLFRTQEPDDMAGGGGLLDPPPATAQCGMPSAARPARAAAWVPGHGRTPDRRFAPRYS
jgi:hypothetical protein